MSLVPIRPESWTTLLAWMRGIKSLDAAPLGWLDVGQADDARAVLEFVSSEACLCDLAIVSPDTVLALGRETGLDAATVVRRLIADANRQIVIVIDACVPVREELLRVIRVMGSQWEINRESAGGYGIWFLVLRGRIPNTGVGEALPIDLAVALNSQNPIGLDTSFLAGQFRGNLFDNRDASAIERYCKLASDAPGSVLLVRQALVRGSISYSGGMWHVDRSDLLELARGLVADIETYGAGKLDGLALRVAQLLALHREPTPLSWVSEYTDVPVEQLQREIASSALAYGTSSDGSDRVTLGSSVMRAALTASIPPPEKSLILAFLVKKLSVGTHGEQLTASQQSMLADYLWQLGMAREGLRAHLRLALEQRLLPARHRNHELVEAACRHGLEHLEQGRGLGIRKRRFVFYTYLRVWVDALWSRNLYAEAGDVLTTWTRRLGYDVPPTLLPFLIRAQLETAGPKAALTSLHVLLEQRVNRQLGYRLLLERALGLLMIQNYEESLGALHAIGSLTVLSKKDQYRHLIYRVMNYEELDDVGRAQTLLNDSMPRALADRCVDEFVLMRVIKARTLVANGQLAEALTEIAQGLRVAHSNGLRLRENSMYRIAASTYAQIGDLGRAKRCHANAIYLAGMLGLKALSGMSWNRLASTEAISGRYGNAMRYARKAVECLSEGGADRDLNQAMTTMYSVQVIVGTDSRTKYARALAARERNMSVIERAFLSYWRGVDLAKDDKMELAAREVSKARSLFERAGYWQNAAWAALREARFCLVRRDMRGYKRAVSFSERMVVNGDVVPSLLFERDLVELLYRYQLRINATDRSAEERLESAIESETDAMLVGEALRVLIRVNARRGAKGKAQDMLVRYRTHAASMIANADSENRRRVATMLEVGEVARESELLLRSSTTREGGPGRPPLEVASH